LRYSASRFGRPPLAGRSLAVHALLAALALLVIMDADASSSENQTMHARTLDLETARPVTPGPGSVSLSGEVPDLDLPPVQPTADAIWTHIAHSFRLDPGVPPPEIYFQSFDQAVQTPEWTEWQKQWTRIHPDIWRDWVRLTRDGSQTEITDEWIGSHIEEVFPFPKTFLAFHYDGTNRIQMNPARTFGPWTQVDPSGVRRDLSGHGYYTMGHEMLHYALAARSVLPTRLHHCIFIHVPDDSDEKPLIEELADHLVDQGVTAAIVRHVGLRNERYFDPCGSVSGSEISQVEAFLQELRQSAQVPRASPPEARRVAGSDGPD